ncbi:hypothetical protein [Devosia neptuniae]|uniref:hypothetical protein n=1 Tax=Devosia neptuniae TaxID=191302 RepID=UPI0022AEE28A|nr:hypothetical protein [Devosia neptuniae]MCZ4345496.1 hypothetical protein [Devosia neptuniae]
MSDWLPIVVLPNVTAVEPIDMHDIALTNRVDPRVKVACRRHPRLRTLLRRFKTAFGDSVEPSVLIVREGTPDTLLETAAVAGFRDAMAISLFTGGRALLISHDSSMSRPIWAETLTLYPWMLDRHGEDMIASTPSMLGVHVVERFRGQSAAGLSHSDIDNADLDAPLFAELSQRWSSRFGGGEVSWDDRALFRSLNMAYQASMMPGGQEAQFYDIGRLIMLWASAFEILLHTGPEGASGKLQVMDLLDSADWYDTRLSAKEHEVRISKKTVQTRTLPSLLYSKIDALRSDFIHGNDVAADQLVTSDGTHYLHVAAVLYRCALAAKLGIKRPQFEDNEEDDDTEIDQAEFLDHFNQWSFWKEPQTRHERALLKAAELPEDED